MHPLTLLPFLLPLALAAIGDSCSSSEGSGSCLETSSCPDSSFTVKGACPSDGASILCCIAQTCSTPAGNGNCQNTANPCSGGSYIAGYCPGGATNMCCVPNSSGGGGGGGGQAILDAAQTQAGVWYSWGGGGCGGKGLGIEQGAGSKHLRNPSDSLGLITLCAAVGFDCSGLTQYAVCQATGKAVTLPRTTRGQYGFGPRVPLEERQVGDLIYYATGGDCSCDSEGFCKNLYHTSIEAGGGMMFEAQKTGTQVGLHPYRASNACPFVIRHW